jgi:hypothetical protein
LKSDCGRIAVGFAREEFGASKDDNIVKIRFAIVKAVKIPWKSRDERTRGDCPAIARRGPGKSVVFPAGGVRRGFRAFAAKVP